MRLHSDVVSVDRRHGSSLNIGNGYLTPLPRHYAAARRSFADELLAAGRDFGNSFQQSRLWTTLAINDIAGRYRGSILGPFWITLAQAVFVFGISIVYGDLMHVSVEKYVPWMASGVVMWTLISGMIMESSDAFISGAIIIRQTALPLPLFVWRVACRSLLNFAHQIVVVLAVAVWFHYLLQIQYAQFMLGLLLVLFNITWMSFIAAIVSARFRDVQQIITTAMQLVFFISPVIWIPGEMSGARGLLLRSNPIYHMLEVTRTPLIGRPGDWHSFLVLAVMGVVGWLFTFLVYGAVRRRIVHYL
jgi:ABC-type polysaccharide/polyol phosphate export permease